MDARHVVCLVADILVGTVMVLSGRILALSCLPLLMSLIFGLTLFFRVVLSGIMGLIWDPMYIVNIVVRIFLM